MDRRTFMKTAAMAFGAALALPSSLEAHFDEVVGRWGGVDGWTMLLRQSAITHPQFGVVTLSTDIIRQIQQNFRRPVPLTRAWSSAASMRCSSAK